MPCEHCIYIFTSPSGKAYIGKTKDFKERRWDHITWANRGSHFPFHRAIRMYGIDNFEVELIPCAESDLNFFEKLFIAFFRSFGKVYNCTDGGDGMNGYSPSPEVRSRISNTLLEYYKNPESRKKTSEATKRGMAAPDVVAKMKAFREKPVSEETRQKMSKASTGRIPSQETLEKRSIALKKICSTPEAKERLRRAASCANTPEKRLAQSIRMKAVWEARRASG
jgi:group I intron endonuclease